MGSHYKTQWNRKECWSCAYWAGKKEKKSGFVMGESIETPSQGICMCEKARYHYGKKMSDSFWNCREWQMDGTVSMAIADAARRENDERIKKERQQAEFEQRQAENRRREEDSRQKRDSLRAASFYASSDDEDEEDDDDCSEEEYQKYLAEKEEKKKKEEFEASKAALEKQIKGIKKSPVTRAISSGGIFFGAFTVGWIPVFVSLLYLWAAKVDLNYAEGLDDKNYHKASWVAEYTKVVEHYSSLSKNLMWIPFGILMIGVLITLSVFFLTKRGVPAKLEKANAKLDELEASYKPKESDKKQQSKPKSRAEKPKATVLTKTESRKGKNANSVTEVKPLGTMVFENEAEMYGQKVKSKITVIAEEHITHGGYNEVVAYKKFFSKYPVIEDPSDRDSSNYVYSMFWEVGFSSVADVRKLHTELFEKGFYKESDDSSSFLSGLKVGELKEVAGKLGLEVKGKKDAIVEQIGSATPYKKMKEVFGHPIYVLSDKANQYLADHALEIEYYFNLSDCDMPLEEFKKLRETKSVEEINFEIHTEHISKDTAHFGEDDYAWLGQYYDEHDDPKKAAELYLSALYIEANGVENYGIWMGCDDKNFRAELIEPIWFDGSLVRSVNEHAQYIDDELIEKACKCRLPFKPCTEDRFKQIVGLIQNGKFDRDSQDKVEKELTENLKGIAPTWRKRKY